MFIIALVTAAMIIILSAFNGLEKLVTDLFGTLDSELALVPVSGEVVEAEISSILSTSPYIAHYSAIIESEAIISANGISEICSVLGVDSNYNKVCSIEKSLVGGLWSSDCSILGYGVKTALRLPSDTLMQETIVFGAPIRGKKLNRHRESAFKKLPLSEINETKIRKNIDLKFFLLK